MFVPTITIDFIGTVSSNPGNRAYGLPQDYGYFRRHDERFKALTMPAVEILEFPRHRHDGVFLAQRACTRKFHMTSDSHGDGFQHLTCLCCIFLKLSHDDDWVVFEKCCII